VSYVEVDRRLHAGAYFGLVSPIADHSQAPQPQTAIVVSQELQLLGQKRSTREEGREPEEVRPVKCGTPVPIAVIG
jgi:hypothetical protein